MQEQALSFCKKKGRPVTIGEVALYLGWSMSLEKIEGLMDDLVEEKSLRSFVREGVTLYERCM